MHLALNEFDKEAKFYKLLDLEQFNRDMTKKKNVHGTVIFATSKVQHDKTKHRDCIKNENPKMFTLTSVNPFTYPVEAEETKVNFRMPLQDFPRDNFTIMVLKAYCLAGAHSRAGKDMNDVHPYNGKGHELVPHLHEITKVLGKEYDKTDFALVVPQDFSKIAGISMQSSATIQ